MDDDAEYRSIVRRETADRVERILRAIREPPSDERWNDVFRHAHTLAGIAQDLDPEVAAEARELTTMLRDASGRPHRLTAEEIAEARQRAHRLAARLDEVERRASR